ncbi:MAG: molybdopterin cofactor-binding domain-containing protein, partial [Gammaproteobacteria bacterium]
MTGRNRHGPQRGEQGSGGAGCGQSAGTDATYTRRDVLHAGTSVGGLLIAIPLTGCGDKPADVAAPTPVGTAPPKDVPQNAWLSINTNGAIRFMSPFSEMGQGVYTSIPTLLAEELGVPVGRIEVVDGGADPAHVNDLLGIQVTGGSTAVRATYAKFRRAGAEARLRLMQAAAERWQVPVDRLTAKDGAVYRGRAPGGADPAESLTYGELAEAAARIAAPADIPLKPKAEFEQIGKPAPRVDTPAKTDGSAEFGIDVRRPGQLYGAIVMCPVLGGTVAGLNELAAREVPGVVDVVLVGNGVVVVAEHFWQAKKGCDALEV